MPQSNFSRQRRAAEKALLNAAEQGKLATLARLVEEGVSHVWYDWSLTCQIQRHDQTFWV